MPITLKLLALVGSGDVKYSIKENVKNKVSGEIYDKVVVLDTNIFKGIPPRNWGKTFRNFISKHLTGKKFLTFDENGKEEIIEFAKPNERVTKNGANNSHKVIDKLSRKSDRNSKLVIVHSDEVINISEKQNENAEHSHQWLDENGWEFRNAFVMDKYGKLYSVTLNIAKSKDGRNILYDINKINEVGYGVVLSNAKGKRSSHINPNFVTNSISQSENNVNTKNNTDKGVDIKYSISDDVIKKFEIENINDYVHVQKQVLSTLNAENFFDDEGGKSKTVINKDSGMVIVINKKGIKETFNNKNYFNYSRNLKLAKLDSIRKIPELIENGKLILDDEKNYHRNNSSIKYAYIVCETKINGKNANIKITVRKSPQNNKFWVHHIYIKKGTERTSAGTSKSSKTAFIPFGATNSISQSENNVNTKNDESGNDIKYSMGGLKAETADKSALEKAMELEKDGTDSEKIRKETGWFKGYDGKWRFEIDNSELKFKTDIEKNRAAAIELAKMKVKSAELEEKIVNNTATKAEENEYYNLDEKMIEYRKGVKLSDVINHPKLFEAYPQLKNVDVYYEISSVNRGIYSSNGNVIMLNPMHTIDEQKEAIIHEIQHAIQEIENFANGSNLEYWKNLGYSDEEAMAMYYNTAGEREARDVSARRDYNAEQRKNIRPDIDRKDVVFANSGDAGYSADENIMQNDFEKKVDQIENNTYNSDDVVIMGRTPKVLQDIGFNSLPVAMTKKHIYSVAVSEARAKNEGRYKQNTNYHDLGFNTVKQIYNKISDPLMVIAHPDFTNKESRDSTHKVIALVDLSVNNKQVIAPIAVDFEGKYKDKHIDVNLVATYFNKNNIHDLIKEAIALENNNQVGFYYLDKKRTQSIIKHEGFQLPSILNNSSSNIIIRKIDSNVNKKINKITQSQQFVRWFGDWQNKPKTASKVVDGNGEPLVVYHQTGNDFTVFDTKHTGAGEFDSEMPTGIFMKPTSDNIGLSGNKQMALYANIRNPLTVNNRAELVRFYEKNIDGYKEARENINDIDSEYEASKKAKSLIDDYFRSSNYDGVIVNNDVGSFGRSTKTYIAFENTQVKSATDNIGTFDGKNPDIRYSIDDTIQSEKYDNLETLDDKEIKVYNKRGWAYGLFNREDMKLLNEKFSELDRHLNSRTDNMLADGTRIVEVNNKIVSIGGTYNDPEIYSVLLINAENETYAEYIKGDVFDEIKCRKCNNVGMLEEIFRTVEFVQGKEDARFYNSFDYRYKKGRRDSGERATLPGDFSRYGYNKESNIRGTSDANAKGEVSAVQLDEDTSDIKYATDDTINDWLDDESTPQGIDYEKAVEKNPVIAVAKIYKSAAQTAKSGLAQGKNVKLDEKEYLRIAGSIMQTYGIKGKYNPNYKKELASQLKNFVDSIGKNDANFTDLFEELVNDCKGGILLSGEYDTTLMKDEREFVLDMFQGKVLLIKPRDVQQIEEDYGSVANYRKKMFGKTYVAVKNKEREEYKKNILKPVANSLLAEATYLNSYLKTLIKNMLLYIIIMRTDIFQNVT
mgnify:CR=1 FL=1